MKTLLLLVGLLTAWENGQVLGDPAISGRELQGKQSRVPLFARFTPACQGCKG